MITKVSVAGRSRSGCERPNVKQENEVGPGFDPKAVLASRRG